jgi:hypothetical protein
MQPGPAVEAREVSVDRLFEALEWRVGAVCSAAGEIGISGPLFSADFLLPVGFLAVSRGSSQLRKIVDRGWRSPF